MSFCASCGLQLVSDAGLCEHHHRIYGDGWALSNRIMCDFFHRGIEPQRLPPKEREDPYFVSYELMA